MTQFPQLLRVMEQTEDSVPTGGALRIGYREGCALRAYTVADPPALPLLTLITREHPIMTNKTILVFAATVALWGANIASGAPPTGSTPPKNVAQKCAAQCPKCTGGFSNEGGKVVSNQAACRQETDMCINECINRSNQPKNTK